MVFAIARVAAADGARDQEQGEDSQKLEHDGAMDGGKNHWPFVRKSRGTGSFGVAGIRHRVGRRNRHRWDTRDAFWYPPWCVNAYV